MNKILCLSALLIMVSCRSYDTTTLTDKDIAVCVVLEKIEIDSFKKKSFAHISVLAVNKTIRNIAVSDKIGFLSCKYTAKGDFFFARLPLDMPRSHFEKFKVLNPNPYYKPNEFPSSSKMSYIIKLPLPEDRTIEELREGEYKFDIGLRVFGGTVKTISIVKDISAKQLFRFIDARKKAKLKLPNQPTK
jgi:hypothetical protein